MVYFQSIISLVCGPSYSVFIPVMRNWSLSQPQALNYSQIKQKQD